MVFDSCGGAKKELFIILLFPNLFASLPQVTREAWVQPAQLEPGTVVVRNIYLSLDPAMRGWMNDQKSYIPPGE